MYKYIYIIYIYIYIYMYIYIYIGSAVQGGSFFCLLVVLPFASAHSVGTGEWRLCVVIFVAVAPVVQRVPAPLQALHGMVVSRCHYVRVHKTCCIFFQS